MFVLSVPIWLFASQCTPARYFFPFQAEDGIRGSLVTGVQTCALPILLLRWLPPAFAVAPEALAVPYAAALGKGTVAAGLLLSAGPVGTIAGEVLAGVLPGRAWRDRLLVPLAAAAFLPLLGYAARPALGPAIALLLLAGAGSAYTLGLDQRFLDATPQAPVRPRHGREQRRSDA